MKLRLGRRSPTYAVLPGKSLRLLEVARGETAQGVPHPCRQGYSVPPSSTCVPAELECTARQRAKLIRAAPKNLSGRKARLTARD